MAKIEKKCEEIVQNLAVRLREIREEKGISKNELSQRSGVSRTSILRIEDGERSPSIYLLLLLTKAMEVELGTLINEVGK